MGNELPLPYGWSKEFDPSSNHWFYVDTKATPPRAIWTHPYFDEQYREEHPDVKEKIDLKPPVIQRRHSFHGQSDQERKATLDSQPNPAAPSPRKRGFFGKLKDKAIGTKEEREAEHLRRVEAQELARQQHIQRMSAYPEYGQYSGGAYGGFPSGSYGSGYGRHSRYGPPAGDPYSLGGFGGMGGMGGRRGGRGMGMGLPLLGGMAGGLILGEMLDGGLGGGGFGGGDFGGGFGGFDGGFGGGGF